MEGLRVRLLGDFQMEGCEPATLGRRQVRTLAKVLALGRGRAVSVDRLIECLWGDEPPGRAQDQISVLISRMRNAVGHDRVRRSDAGYALALDWLDLDALEEYATEAERRLSAGATGAAWTAASAGLSLVRGPLLADEPDAPWADTERAFAERLVGRLLGVAADGAVAAGDWVKAAEFARQLQLRDPYDEAALRTLMVALSRAGRPASALSAYAAVRERLRDDLGVSPSVSTEALHEQLLQVGEAPYAESGAALGDAATGPTSTVPGRAPPGEASDAGVELPGREAALQALDAVLDRALGGAAQVAVVEGEAGIGKSRLLATWFRRAVARGADVIMVSCDPLGRTLALQPLFDAVNQLIERFGPDGAEEVVGADLAVLGPLLGRTPLRSGTFQLAALADPDAGRVMLFAALFSVFARQSARQPLVIVIDDVHMGDGATVSWLSQAGRRLAGSPVAVVTSRRAEEATALAGVTTISLGPLDRHAVEAVVGGGRADALYARSGGNPLFLVELAAADDGVELPDSIRQAVEERCARAGPAAPTLRTAAVIGPDVDLDLLATVLGHPPGQVLDHLEEGVRRRFLVERGSSFGFAHELVREAMASSVSAARSAYIHRQAGRALAARDKVDFLAVARHDRLGGDRSHASSMLVAAARLAVGRFDQTAALRLLDEAIALDDSVDARTERARVFSMLGRYQQAAEDIAVAQDHGAGAAALEVAAWSAHYQRRLGEARLLADRGARDADDPDVRSSCQALGGWVSLAIGDFGGAERRLSEALATGSHSAAQLALGWMGWLRFNQGRPEETLQLVTARPGDGLARYRFPNAYAYMAATIAEAMLGRPDAALRSLDSLQQAVERMDAERWRARPLNMRGWIARNLGAPSEADDYNHAAVEMARAQNMAEPLANGLLDLVSGCLQRSDGPAAAALLDEVEVVAAPEHAFRWRHRLRGRLLRARLQLLLEDPETAYAASLTLADDAGRLGAVRCHVQAKLVSAMAAHRCREAVDRDEVGRLLSRLDGVAGLEAWWLTAEAAREFANDAWETLAGRRVAQLAERAGPYRESLMRAASGLRG
ncbi:MAG TPA: BTAD domain-containing putative transcriptional regulator [Acidimicrobiales bacterium]|nr:BTAD domain-containing putative transcriptional regulator [Acidimicrobiales bacterium]